MRLADRYRLIRRVGEGGGGGVYLVEDRLAGDALMVLKRLHAQAQTSLAQWLANEFQILAQLDLPAVARVYDFGLASADAEDPGGVFFTRAYVEGTPLDDALRSTRGTPDHAARVRRIFVQAASALRELHRLGVVHGDLKPANLIVERDGDGVVLIDFGLAHGALGAAASVRGGTLAFMAPERVAMLLAGEALPPDPRADVYALSVTLRCVLAGEMLAHDAPAPDEVARDAALLSLWEVASRGAAESPARRVATMDDLLAALGHASDAALAGRRVVLRPEGREAELGVLLDAVARRLVQRETSVSCVLVTGAEGSGRSTLLRELTWRAQLRGAQVLTVQGVAGDVPARRLREGAGILAGEAVDASAHDAVLTAFRKAASSSPVLVLADDLDRADPAIAAQLRSIAYGCEAHEALLVVATAEEGTRVRDLEPGLHVPLGALDESSVAALCAQTLGAVEPAVVSIVHRRSGGLPLAVVGMLSALARDTAVTPSDVERLEVPAQAHELAARRVAAMAPATREALIVVDALAREATTRALRFAGISDTVLAAARDTGVLHRDAGSRWTLTQPALGTAALDTLAPDARRALLTRVAAALDHAGASVTARCEAWARAGDVTRASSLLGEAVAALRAEGVPLTAAKIYETLRHVPREGTDIDAARALLEEAELLQEGGMVAEAESLAARVDGAGRELTQRALLLRGRLRRTAGDDEGAEVLLAAARAAADDADTAAEAIVESARAAMARGDYGAVRTRCDEAASLARAPRIRASARALGGVAALYAGETAQGTAMLEAARGDYASLALPREEANLLVYLAIGRERSGDLAGARILHEQSLDRARAAGDLQAMATARINLGHIAQRTGDLGAALEHNEAALKLARRAGLRTAVQTARLNLASQLLRIGSLDRARAEIDEALELAREAGHRDITAAATLMLGVATARGGDADRGLAMIDEAEEMFRTLGHADDAADALLDAAEVLLDRGDTYGAAERLGRARGECPELGLRAGRAKLLDARVALEHGDIRAAMGAAEEAITTGERDLDWEVHALALALRAQVHASMGAELHARKDRERAIEVLEARASLLPPDLRGAFWSVARRASLRVDVAPHAPTPSVVEYAVSEVPSTPLRLSATSQSVMSALRSATSATSATLLASDERLLLLLDLSRRLGEAHSVDHVLEQAVRSAVELTRAERGAILLEGHGGKLEVRVRTGGARNDGPDEEFSRSIADSVWIDGEPVVTLNAQGDRRFSDFRSVHELGIAAVAAVPLRVVGRTIGVLYVESRRRRTMWSSADVALMTAFAEQAGLAVEHARLVEQLEARTRELEAARREIEALLETRTQELEATRTSLARAQEALTRRFAPDGFVTHTEAMRRVFAVVERVRDADVPVVIEGESGTGKELVARALHFSGTRSRGPFVVVNCGAIPETLLEGELFGHVRGAFTGAERDRKGLIANAHGGTLFLDEMSEMSARMQVELLRVIQDRRVRPVGGEVDEKVDVRFVAASNRPLRDLVAEGRFREDLYYRLSVVTLRLPPLRERLDDIPALANHFLVEFAREHGGGRKRLSREALAKLLRSSWPGNVRQLRHALESAVVLCEGDVIEADTLRTTESSSTPSVGAQTAVSATQSGAPSPLAVRKASERQKIFDALEEVNWNKVRAAQLLGMPRRTLYRRLREYGFLEEE